MKTSVLLAIMSMSVGLLSHCNVHKASASNVKTLDYLAGLGSKECDASPLVSNASVIPALLSGSAISGGTAESKRLVMQELARMPLGLQNLFFSSFDGKTGKGWSGKIQLLNSSDFKAKYKSVQNTDAPSELLSFRYPSSGAINPVIYLLDDKSSIRKSTIRSMAFFFSEIYFASGDGQVAFGQIADIDSMTSSFEKDLAAKGIDKCSTPFGKMLVSECGSPQKANVQGKAYQYLNYTPEGVYANVGRTVLAEAMDSFYCSSASMDRFKATFKNTWVAFSPVADQLAAQFGVPAIPVGKASMFSLDDTDADAGSGADPEPATPTVQDTTPVSESKPSSETVGGQDGSLPGEDNIMADGSKSADPNLTPAGGQVGGDPYSTAALQSGKDPSAKTSDKEPTGGDPFSSPTKEPSVSPDAKSGESPAIGGDPFANVSQQKTNGSSTKSSDVPASDDDTPTNEKKSSDGSSVSGNTPPTTGQFKTADGSTVTGTFNSSGQVNSFSKYSNGQSWVWDSNRNTYISLDSKGNRTGLDAKMANGQWYYSPSESNIMCPMGTTSQSGSCINLSGSQLPGTGVDCPAYQTVANGVCYQTKPMPSTSGGQPVNPGTTNGTTVKSSQGNTGGGSSQKNQQSQQKQQNQQNSGGGSSKSDQGGTSILGNAQCPASSGGLSGGLCGGSSSLIKILSDLLKGMSGSQSNSQNQGQSKTNLVCPNPAYPAYRVLRGPSCYLK